MMNETHFSQFCFIQAVANSSENKMHILKIPVTGSGPDRYMYGIAERDRFGRRYVLLAPFGLYASPGWNKTLATETVRKIVKTITGYPVARFNWNVRFDHQSLAESLISFGFKYEQQTTHILDLSPGYERIFSNFTATVRNQIRKSMRKGVRIERVYDEASVRAYHAIYIKLVEEQKRGWSYPVELFLELAKETASTFFLMAIAQSKIIGGGIFFYDGCSMRYWHGAADRTYSNLFPTCLLIDYAIRQSCEAEKSFFGFGGSAGKASLEQFKSYWGTERKQYWEFRWQHPLWAFASSWKRKLLKVTH
ncbi:MAG: GNAT family N-acetyltransferase [Verrucomicrobiota bacterium]|jgi:lipid II:glycine glycyltransferase (peptidoglycan interpeptide bridge formation enzyme)